MVYSFPSITDELQGKHVTVPTLSVVALAAALSLFTPLFEAHGAPISQTYFFKATDFSPVPAPSDPVIGQVTASFEPGVAMSAPASVDSVVLSIAGVSFGPMEVIFQYLAGPEDIIQFGGILAGFALEPGTVDFFFEFGGAASGKPVQLIAGTGFQYGDTDLVEYASSGLMIGLTPFAVAEPESVLVFLIGLVALTWRIRRPKRVVRAP